MGSVNFKKKTRNFDFLDSESKSFREDILITSLPLRFEITCGPEIRPSPRWEGVPGHLILIKPFGTWY